MVSYLSKRSAQALLFCFVGVLAGCGTDSEPSDNEALQKQIQQYTESLFTQSTLAGIEGQRSASILWMVPAAQDYGWTKSTVATVYGFPEASSAGFSGLDTGKWQITEPDVTMPQGFETIVISRGKGSTCGVIYSINTEYPQAPLVKLHCTE